MKSLAEPFHHSTTPVGLVLMAASNIRVFEAFAVVLSTSYLPITQGSSRFPQAATSIMFSILVSSGSGEGEKRRT